MHLESTIHPCFENENLPCRVKSQTLLCRVNLHSRNGGKHFTCGDWWEGRAGGRDGVHLHTSINSLLFAQRNLLHNCLAMTFMSKSCCNFHCPKAIN
jgi:hypothetical protein